MPDLATEVDRELRELAERGQFVTLEMDYAMCLWLAIHFRIARQRALMNLFRDRLPDGSAMQRLVDSDTAAEALDGFPDARIPPEGH